MSEKFLVVDAWIREAQEVARVVEDIESRLKNMTNLEQEYRFKETAKSKLFEVGIKLDRLESLLLNPPSKPILTKEDVEFRWEMLSDFRRRTRELALSIYSSPSSKRIVTNTEDSNKTFKGDDEDHIDSLFLKDDPEMLKPLISEGSTESHEQQMKQSGSCIPMTMSIIKFACYIICSILGAAMLLVLLVIICAAI